MNSQSGFIFLIPLFIFATFFVLAYWLIGQPHRVSGNSMAPTLVEGEFILTNKMDKDFKKGDIIVFKNPENEDQDFIKRIIGMSGDKVLIKDNQFFLNGNKLEENYLLEGSKTAPNDFLPQDKEEPVPEDSFFVMGDNRDYSSDSRKFGFIKKDKIIGKYWISYYKP